MSYADNRHCAKGVSFLKQSRKFRARIVREGVTYLIGYYDKLEDAEAAYDRVENHPDLDNIVEPVSIIKMKANAQIREISRGAE